MDALERDRDQRREGIEELALLRDAQQAAVVRLDREYAARADRGAQRDEEDFAARECVRTEAGRLALVEGPLGRSRPAARAPRSRETCVRSTRR
jgi:hypothetical protein